MGKKKGRRTVGRNSHVYYRLLAHEGCQPHANETIPFDDASVIAIELLHRIPNERKRPDCMAAVY